MLPPAAARTDPAAQRASSAHDATPPVIPAGELFTVVAIFTAILIGLTALLVHVAGPDRMAILTEALTSMTRVVNRAVDGIVDALTVGRSSG